MAWVSRTTRENNRVGFNPGNTPAHVGPGSYRQASAFRKRKGPSFAPFSSTADRSGGVLAEVTSHYTPGPGAYVTAGANQKVAQHHAASTPFLSLAERFRPPRTKDTPGPGAYKAPSTFRRTAAKKDGPKGGDPPAVTWVRVPTAPSIPAPSQSYGYEEGRYGELTMQKAPGNGHTGRGSDTAGPGSYNPNDRVLAGRKRVAVDFGRSRSRRTDFAKSEVPGPGEYTGPIAAPKGAAGAWVRDAAKPSSTFASRVGRGPVKHKANKPTPGPGSYGINTAFRKEVHSRFHRCIATAGANVPHLCLQAVPERQQFFGSTSRRFKHRRSQSGA